MAWHIQDFCVDILNMIKKTTTLLILLLIVSITTSQTYGEGNTEKLNLPDNIKAGIEHLRTISSHKTKIPFNPEAVHELLAFLLTTKSDTVLYYAKKRSEEHTSELKSHWYISYAVFCLKKKTFYFSFFAVSMSYYC